MFPQIAITLQFGKEYVQDRQIPQHIFVNPPIGFQLYQGATDRFVSPQTIPKQLGNTLSSLLWIKNAIVKAEDLDQVLPVPLPQ